MKEISIRPETAIESIDQKQIVKRKQFIGDMQPANGCIMWELDTVTMEVVPATYEIITADFNDMQDKDVWTPKTKGVIITRENCLYDWALNKKNAARKFRKSIYGV